jgi:AraC family transcriptional regulator of adaptative response/methylated-DNA-[protein]-cysteine methyltransferase
MSPKQSVIMSMMPEKQMRAAIKARDYACDGRFVYAIVTTGVFCRPSCAARPARPENYRFFPNAGAAEEAGFRPCKRCRPTERQSDIANLIESARYVIAHADETLTLSKLAKRAGLSVSRYQRAFSAAIGISPKALQDAARMGELKKALKSGDAIAGAIFEAGYGSTSRVYGEAVRSTGMTPGVYRAGGTGEVISYACRNTVLGWLLMAATDRGVCSAQFGDSTDALIAQLKEEFPNADIKPSKAAQSPDLNVWIDALDAHLAEKGPRPDVPLDLKGTAFQVKVWRFLLSIKDGDIVSYGEAAAALGKPKAHRALATACGKNRVAVLVPCHRVLRGNGDLGGYRWGVERKRALLDAERARRAAS